MHTEEWERRFGNDDSPVKAKKVLVKDVDMTKVVSQVRIGYVNLLDALDLMKTGVHLAKGKATPLSTPIRQIQEAAEEIHRWLDKT